MSKTETPRYPRPAYSGAGSDPLALIAPSRRTAMAQIELANESYSNHVRHIQTLEMDYPVQLTACETSSEAMTVVAHWMAKRVDVLIGAQREFFDAWLAYSMTQPDRSGAPRQGSSTDVRPKRTRAE